MKNTQRVAPSFQRLRALLGLCACGFAAAAANARADGLAAAPPLAWHLSTSSATNPAPAGRDASLYSICGKPDEALIEVAARNTGRVARNEAPFSSDELGFALRVAGAPDVWPRSWSVSGKDLDTPDIEKRLAAWSDSSHPVGQARCGISRTTTRDGRTIVSAVEVDALADLEPLPTLTRVGEWVTLKGHMLVPASEVKVVLLGPKGLPKTVLASLSGDDLRATFSVDTPGAWLVQVLATVETGPRPVLEGFVHAGTLPATSFADSPAPGEEAEATGMRAMVNAARATEGLPALAEDATLDKLAKEHAQHMFDKKTIGHDVGDGDPRSRVLAAGLNPKVTGENVAAASTLAHAHRALWASPSHRGNILEKRFANIGVGVVKGPDGRVWVAELFTD